jgi:hypothetical protein
MQHVCLQAPATLDAKPFPARPCSGSQRVVRVDDWDDNEEHGPLAQGFGKRCDEPCARACTAVAGTPGGSTRHNIMQADSDFRHSFKHNKSGYFES